MSDDLSSFVGTFRVLADVPRESCCPTVQSGQYSGQGAFLELPKVRLDRGFRPTHPAALGDPIPIWHDVVEGSFLPYSGTSSVRFSSYGRRLGCGCAALEDVIDALVPIARPPCAGRPVPPAEFFSCVQRASERGTPTF